MTLLVQEMKIIRPINAGGKWGLRFYKWFGAPLLSILRVVRHPMDRYGQEILYERLFSNALNRLHLENRYYPTGGAANFSLMYLLLRSVTELPVRRVVELGCGQSTLLLDAVRQLRHFEIVTLEHEWEWAQRIQMQVKHDITRVDLVDKVVQNRKTRVYDTDAGLDASPPDLLLVDGPQGGSRRSRWAALQWIERGLGDDFLVLFDDAERRGEIDTIEETLSLLRSQERTFRTRFYYGMTWQFVIAAGKFTPATLF